MKLAIGTFFKDKDKAIKELEKQNKLWEDAFIVLTSKDGYLVVAKRQLDYKEAEL